MGPSRFFVVVLAIIVGVGGCRASTPNRDDVVIVADTDAAAPMKLRAMFWHGAGYQVVIRDLALKRSPRSPKPVVLMISGCGYADWAADAPDDAVLLMVDADPVVMTARTKAEACADQDAPAIAAAAQAELEFLLANVGRVRFADPERVVIFASGEAAPVVAGHSARAAGKVLLGDPCLVAWPARLDISTPTLVPWGGRPEDWHGRSGKA